MNQTSAHLSKVFFGRVHFFVAALDAPILAR